MPRISFPVDDKTYGELKTFLPWGTQVAVFQAMTTALISTVQQHGPGVVGLLVNGKFNFLTRELTEIQKLEMKGE